MTTQDNHLQGQQPVAQTADGTVQPNPNSLAGDPGPPNQNVHAYTPAAFQASGPAPNVSGQPVQLPAHAQAHPPAQQQPQNRQQQINQTPGNGNIWSYPLASQQNAVAAQQPATLWRPMITVGWTFRDRAIATGRPAWEHIRVRCLSDDEAVWWSIRLYG